MGDFDLPGVKVESQALLNFAKGAAEDYGTYGETIREQLPKLGMKVGLSGLPSGATLGTWNNATLLATMNFIKDSGFGLEAVTTGAMSVAAIYQESDSDAEAQMNAVNSAFYPVSSDASLSSRRAEEQAAAQERGEQTENEILEESTQTSIMDSQTSTDSPAMVSGPTACYGPNPNTANGAQALVEQHKDNDEYDAENGGHTEYDEYEAPEDTPEGANVPGAPEVEEPDTVIMAPGPIEPSGPTPTPMV